MTQIATPGPAVPLLLTGTLIVLLAFYQPPEPQKPVHVTPFVIKEKGTTDVNLRAPSPHYQVAVAV